jgi:SOS response regulatory protein OraA/RecX
VLERLAAAGYLDDGRVLRERARRLAERGYGDAAIRVDLARRGGDSDAVEQALTALEPEAERIERLLRTLGDGPRTLRTLARRGFSDAVLERVSEAVAQDPSGG